MGVGGVGGFGVGIVFGDGLIGCELFVAGERDIGAGFEELFPELRGDGQPELVCGMMGAGYLRSIPDVARVFGVLFNDGEDTGSDDSVCSTEVVVDL